MGMYADSALYSFDVNGDGIKDDVNVMFSKDSDGKLSGLVADVALRDENGQIIPQEDIFVMIGDQKFQMGEEVTCGHGKATYQGIQVYIDNIVAKPSSAGSFPGELIQIGNDYQFVAVSFRVDSNPYFEVWLESGVSAQGYNVSTDCNIQSVPGMIIFFDVYEQRPGNTNSWKLEEQVVNSNLPWKWPFEKKDIPWKF